MGAVFNSLDGGIASMIYACTVAMLPNFCMILVVSFWRIMIHAVPWNIDIQHLYLR